MKEPAEPEFEVRTRRDIEWVYTHLDDKSATAQTAPGPGAWSMLEHFRIKGNRADFFRTYVPKLMTGSEGEAAAPAREDGRAIASLCRSLVSIKRKAEKKAAAAKLSQA